MKVVGSEGTVALGALPLSGVVTHLQAFVAEHVETLGEHRLFVSRVAAGAAQLGLETHKTHCIRANHCLANTVITSIHCTLPQPKLEGVTCNILDIPNAQWRFELTFWPTLMNEKPLPANQANYTRCSILHYDTLLLFH